MGVIRAGFTGAFFGIVISVAALFIKYEWLKTLAGLGFLLAASFGKVCIDTATEVCSLSEKFMSFIAAILGNVVAYFIIGVIISLLISIIKMWSSSAEPQAQAPQPVVIQQAQPVVETPKPVIVVTKPLKQKKKKK